MLDCTAHIFPIYSKGRKMPMTHLQTQNYIQCTLHNRYTCITYFSYFMHFTKNNCLSRFGCQKETLAFILQCLWRVHQQWIPALN